MGLTLSAWIASALLTYVYAGRVMLVQVDRQLEQYSDLVNYITQVFARQVDEGLPVSEPWFRDGFEQSHLYPMVIDAQMGEQLKPALNIWMGGELLAVLADSPRFGPATEAGFEFVGLGDGSQWRVLSRYDAPNQLWIRVGIDLDAARVDLLGILGRALLPLLVVLPLTVLVLYFGVSRGLRPLQQLAGQIARRKPGLLDPVPTLSVPQEVQELVHALNQLLERLAQALEAEQRFTANAAHELLTPLAAIKTEVQLCQRQMGDPDGAHMLGRIAQRVDRANHTVQQLLTLARHDPQYPLPLVTVDLNALLQAIVAEMSHLADSRGVSFELDTQAPTTVQGDAESLSILLRNLLVNASRYALEGSVVNLSLKPEALEKGGIELQICNACAALPAAEFDRLTQRFYRAPGSVGLGAGLGLSIVASIASQHGASVSISSEQESDRFCVRISFPGSRFAEVAHAPRQAGPDVPA